MAQVLYFLEQAERCRRLGRDSTDPVLRDSLLTLADEYSARAADLQNAKEDGDTTVWQTRSDDKDAD